MGGHHGEHYWQAVSVKPAYELLAESTSPYGEITATLDWCEENLFSPLWFVAEFFNSISNFGMFALGLYGAYRSYKQSLATRFIVSYLCLAVVGIGSFLFHATLLFESQLADELPMMWADGAFLYCMAPHNWRKNDTKRFLLLSVIALYTFGVSGIYIYTRNVIFFEVSYGLGVVLLFGHCLHWASNKGAHPKFAAQRRLIAIGAMSLVGAFTVWNIDNFFCNQLRAARVWLNSPYLAPLLQFHAWWHLGAGYATYLLGLFLSYRDVVEDEEMYGTRCKLTHGSTWFGLPILVENLKKDYNK